MLPDCATVMGKLHFPLYLIQMPNIHKCWGVAYVNGVNMLNGGLTALMTSCNTSSHCVMMLALFVTFVYITWPLVDITWPLVYVTCSCLCHMTSLIFMTSPDLMNINDLINIHDAAWHSMLLATIISATGWARSGGGSLCGQSLLNLYQPIL